LAISFPAPADKSIFMSVLLDEAAFRSPTIDSFIEVDGSFCCALAQVPARQAGRSTKVKQSLPLHAGSLTGKKGWKGAGSSTLTDYMSPRRGIADKHVRRIGRGNIDACQYLEA
jgi:hypothetical protein